jgi:SpoVK/Ycf46/Vps4 family AAA+-type ATPase
MDLDKAFLRRMPVSIKTVAPDLRGRLDILRKMLVLEKLDVDVDLQNIAMRTDDFTGSDLRELVRLYYIYLYI